MAKDNEIKKDTMTPEQNGPEKDPGTDNGNQPVEEVKVGFFANALGMAGKALDTGVGFVRKAGKKVVTTVVEHPIASVGGAIAIGIGAAKVYSAWKGGETPDDNVIDVEWQELPAVPEVPQIQEVQTPVVEVPQIVTPEVVEVLDAVEVEGPTEGIFDEQ